ncbi:MAG: acetyltransferase [Gammaproteobacteria bacterium]
MADAEKIQRDLAEAVRRACLDAAREGYEQAALAGLCHEGAMEASLDAIRALRFDALLADDASRTTSAPPHTARSR